jgi:hypothetical protein
MLPSVPRLIDWVAVDGDGDRVRDARVAHDVMAAADALDVPAPTFENLD